MFGKANISLCFAGTRDTTNAPQNLSQEPEGVWMIYTHESTRQKAGPYNPTTPAQDGHVGEECR